MNLRIKNLINEERKIKLVLYIKTVLGEDEYLTNGNLKVENTGNCLKIKNAFREECFKNKTMFISSNLKINSYTGDKDDFIGNGDVLNPEGLYKNLNNSSGLGKDSCIAIEFILKFSKL